MHRGAAGVSEPIGTAVMRWLSRSAIHSQPACTRTAAGRLRCRLSLPASPCTPATVVTRPPGRSRARDATSCRRRTASRRVRSPRRAGVARPPATAISPSGRARLPRAQTVRACIGDHHAAVGHPGDVHRVDERVGLAGDGVDPPVPDAADARVADVRDVDRTHPRPTGRACGELNIAASAGPSRSPDFPGVPASVRTSYSPGAPARGDSTRSVCPSASATRMRPSGVLATPCGDARRAAAAGPSACPLRSGPPVIVRTRAVLRDDANRVVEDVGDQHRVRAEGRQANRLVELRRGANAVGEARDTTPGNDGHDGRARRLPGGGPRRCRRGRALSLLERPVHLHQLGVRLHGYVRCTGGAARALGAGA